MFDLKLVASFFNHSPKSFSFTCLLFYKYKILIINYLILFYKDLSSNNFQKFKRLKMFVKELVYFDLLIIEKKK